jgi:hypothetical protein
MILLMWRTMYNHYKSISLMRILIEIPVNKIKNMCCHLGKTDELTIRSLTHQV